MRATEHDSNFPTQVAIPMNEVMIEAQGLTKRYDGVVALNKVSMEVRRGEVLGFLGPNGAGKSTTMKILTCYTAPSEGTAKVNGCDIFENPLGVRSAIGYLPESTALYQDMLVLEYLQFVAEMRGIRGGAQRKRIKKVVEETDLGNVFAQEIGTLSKGYKQRVGLAQALIHEPPILILDEPMSGLDPNQAVEIRDLIKDIGRSRTVILSTHNLSEVQVACDRVLIIAQGGIVANDTPQHLAERSGRPLYRVTLQKQQGLASDRVEKVLGQISGADSVRLVASDETDALQFEVAPSAAQDLRADIFAAAVANDYTLLGLQREGGSLEQVFRQLTANSKTNTPAPSSDSAAA